MATFAEQLKGFLNYIQGAPLPRPTSEPVPPEQCLPADSAGVEIPEGSAYFNVRISEIFLKQGRQLFDEFDPMVVVLTDFSYGRERISVPFIVGPSLFQNIQSAIHSDKFSPHGLVYNDILVAGPHPFRGGNFGLTIILYKIKRKNYAQEMLNLVEGVSSAIGMPVNMAMLARVGGTLLTGLESILQMHDTVPLLGMRTEFDTSKVDGFVSGYGMLSAIVPVPVEIDEAGAIG